MFDQSPYLPYMKTEAPPHHYFPNGHIPHNSKTSHHSHLLTVLAFHFLFLSPSLCVLPPELHLKLQPDQVHHLLPWDRGRERAPRSFRCNGLLSCLLQGLQGSKAPPIAQEIASDRSGIDRSASSLDHFIFILEVCRVILMMSIVYCQVHESYRPLQPSLSPKQITPKSEVVAAALPALR